MVIARKGATIDENAKGVRPAHLHGSRLFTVVVAAVAVVGVGMLVRGAVAAAWLAIV